MQHSAKPQFLAKYDVRETYISPFCRQLSFDGARRPNHLFLAELYPGVQVRSLALTLTAFDLPPVETYHMLTVDFCFSGCCKIPHPEKHAVYVSQGRVNIDIHPFVGRMEFPMGTYTGLSVQIDRYIVGHTPPQSWAECGLRMESLVSLPASKTGNYLTCAAPRWEQLARRLSAELRSPDASLGDCRFLLLELLWTLQSESQGRDALETSSLTRGQHAAVQRAIALLTHDLRRRYTIGELSEELGLSPASLKKYFSTVYGKSIAAYMCELRMKRAQELLTTTALSIAQIASEVGYENQGKFGAMFRREVGTSPLEYRRIYRFAQKAPSQ